MGRQFLLSCGEAKAGHTYKVGCGFSVESPEIKVYGPHMFVPKQFDVN